MANETIIREFDWKEIGLVAEAAVAEGCVLIKNKNKALPVKNGEKVALFGRSQFNYYKSGTGSGGAVNAPYVIGIYEALAEADKENEIILDANVRAAYEEWIKDNPFDAGEGWAAEPWNQKEMPLSDELVKNAADANDIAIVIIGRTAGEDKDNHVAEGSYLLTADETAMLTSIRANFKRVAVVLNTGNIIDMKWVDEINPDAVLYAWQGGMVGGAGCTDVLLGKVCPSGRLSDTIAKDMEDYPSTAYFGDEERNFYAEDIYVGYRYFETFAKDKVLYPFGYGLSYTTFDISAESTVAEVDEVIISAKVRNTGDCAGSQVVQLYISKPQGNIGNPARELVGFAKTGAIKPGEEETVTITVPMKLLASYDDNGASGYKYAYVALAGEYKFYLGDNVRSAEEVYSVTLAETVLVEQLEQALAPVRAFDRMCPKADGDGFKVAFESAPLREYDIYDRINENRPASPEYTGDKGIKLADVYEGRNSLDEFLAQLSDLDLIYMSRGEGMCSPKVTPGTASAFGGVTDSLAAFGIPVGCCSDGPSGIRMDCGTAAFSMPNGTLLACTFNTELIEKLYELEGLDLRKNKVDLLLGPGINMHRNPLNGRNFEYFSEDPYLTGAMAVAQLKGMHRQGVSGTVKHFAGNEQEYKRYEIDSVVSERALREIYLKPFEMAVREGKAYSIMTTYGSLNGLWTAGSYDLVTTILRKEWGFDGIAMTDWWAMVNEENGEPSMQNTAPMIRAQNDVYMVVSDSFTNTAKDNAEEALADGRITRGDLVRNAANICKVLMRSRCMPRLINGEEEKWTDIGLPEGMIENIDWTRSLEMDKEGEIDLSDVCTEKGTIGQIDITFKTRGYFDVIFEISSTDSSIAQMPFGVFSGTALLGTISTTGTGGKIIEKSVELVSEVMLSANVKLKFGMTGIKLHKMKVKLKEEYIIK